MKNHVSGLRPATLLIKRFRQWHSPVNFVKSFRTHFYRALAVAASVIPMFQNKAVGVYYILAEFSQLISFL